MLLTQVSCEGRVWSQNLETKQALPVIEPGTQAIELA